MSEPVRPRRRSQPRHRVPILAAVTTLMAVLTLVGSFLAVTHQNHIGEASGYNRTFDLSQTAIELLRLQGAIERTRTGGDGTEAAMRLEILRNRLLIAPSSYSPRDEVRRDEIAAIAQLGTAITVVTPLIQRLPDEAAARAALRELQLVLSPSLHAATLSNARSGDAIAADQQQLHLIFTLLCAVTLGFVLSGGALMAVVLGQNRYLDQVASKDPLTGLPNRFAFRKILERHAGETCAIALVNIDHFKTVNDTLGHETGDLLLLALAERIGAVAGDSVLARVGGDEFALLATGEKSEENLVAMVKRLHEGLRAPLQLGARSIQTSVTTGISSGRSNASDPLFKSADVALHAAKAAGRGMTLVYEPAMTHDLMRRERLRDDLKLAIERSQLHLLYQPVVDLDSGTTRGFEALLRWHHPELGPISPVEFIPIAEKYGWIVPIGRWVIETALHEAQRWPSDIFVAVNVSASQLGDVSLPDHVDACLAAYAIGHGRLEIEITESTLIENDEAALAVLHRLRALGCKISLDDFGTGYASLSYLTRFPFEKVKIDQSFLRGGTPGDIAIIGAICDLADRLRLEIVAEGIETEQHRSIVSEVGGRLGQGYLFDRPLAGESAKARLETERPSSLAKVLSDLVTEAA